jgi:hypothetical protein
VLTQLTVCSLQGIFPHISVNLPRKDPAKVARLFAEAQTLVGLITQDASGSETARTEGMPLITSRTTQSVEIEAGQPAESPIGRRVKMSMEMFLQSNPYVRQLLAEADCLGMREYIVEQVPYCLITMSLTENVITDSSIILFNFTVLPIKMK